MSKELLSLRQWKLSIGATICVTLLLFAGGGVANAQADTTAEQTQSATTEVSTEQQYVPTAYDYTVVKDNNMTLLVRKSIQLYDQATPGVSLNEAQTVFAETNIIKDMKASNLIHPGTDVKIDSSLVEKYANTSQDLSETVLAAWQAFANHARFDLSYIKANNVVKDTSGNLVNPDTLVQAQNTDQATSPALTDLATTTNSDSSSAWYWWFVGLGTVALLWYIVWRRQEIEIK